MVDNDFKERMERLKALFDRAPIKKTFGMELSFNEAGQAIFDMPYNPDLDHALGGIHGGVIATLLDNAGWFTAAARYDYWIATIDIQTRLLERAEKQHLRSIGELVRAGRRLATTRMELRADDGKLVAIGSASFSVTSLPVNAEK